MRVGKSSNTVPKFSHCLAVRIGGLPKSESANMFTFEARMVDVKTMENESTSLSILSKKGVS